MIWKYGDQIGWGPFVQGDQIFGDHLSMGTKFDGDRLSRGTKLVGDHLSRGTEFLGTGSGGPETGDQMGSGPNESQPKVGQRIIYEFKTFLRCRRYLGNRK